eukprot:TRINITY_DN13003_c0_g1_i1.p1 TRINITY_DN13003_c0_g1~~TRINITY_DN13003_c0_g1_i1.p1  ORF type:complete len:383 (+),score=56.99 TRINITY_DN13003_c0_g1_i1:121-1269(+)
MQLQHMGERGTDDRPVENLPFVPYPMERTSTDDLEMDLGFVHRQVTDQLWPEATMPVMSPQQLQSMMMQGMQQQMAVMSVQGEGSLSTAYPMLAQSTPIALLSLLPAEEGKGLKNQSQSPTEAGKVTGSSLPMPNVVGDPKLAAAALQAEHRSHGQPAALATRGNNQTLQAWEDVTTVMVRNIPNRYNQQLLLEELKTRGFLGCYDFLYVPIDPETQANRGYAFINFIDAQFAWMFRLAYEGRKMGSYNSEKLVSVSPAKLQGFEANYLHYSSARVNRGDPALRPLFLREPNVPCSKHERRRGGRRGQGSLIDMVDRQSQTAESSGLSAVEGKRAGQEVSQKADMLPQTSQSQISDQINSCRSCGGNVKSSFRFCQFCGAQV